MARSEEEKLLIELLLSGDPGAFRQFVELYSKSAFHLAFRFVGDPGAADDIVQESVLKAFKGLNHFRGESSLKNWFLRITVNTAKNHLRSQKRHSAYDISDIEIGVNHKDFNRTDNAQTLEILHRAIECLPPRQKETLHLRIFEDMAFKEIAEILETPFDTAKANFRHAIMSLKKILVTLDQGKGWDSLKLAFESLSEDESYEY